MKSITCALSLVIAIYLVGIAEGYASVSSLDSSLVPINWEDGVGLWFYVPSRNAVSAAFLHRVATKLDRASSLTTHGFLTANEDGPELQSFYVERPVPFRAPSTATGYLELGSALQTLLRTSMADLGAPSSGRSLLRVLQDYSPVNMVQCGLVCALITKPDEQAPLSVRVAVFDSKAKKCAHASASGTDSWDMVTRAPLQVVTSSKVDPDSFACPQSVERLNGQDLVVAEKVACGLTLRCVEKLGGFSELGSKQSLQAVMEPYSAPIPNPEAYLRWGQGLVTGDVSRRQELFQESIAIDNRFPNARLSLALLNPEGNERKQSLAAFFEIWPDFHLRKEFE